MALVKLVILRRYTMRDHSTRTTMEFIISVAGEFVIGFIWYKNLLFRVLPHHDFYESLKTLFVLSVVSMMVYLILFRRWKNGWTASSCFVMPFGIYTVITYAVTSPTFIRIVTVITFLLSTGYTILSLTRKVKKKRKNALVKR